MSPEPRVFLKARWKNLVLFNYAVSDELLLPFLPKGCELDSFGGRAFVSLVAFQFLDTSVFGVKWLGLVNFPEINLRFYVRLGGQRGVCFIKEFVPSPLVAGIARAFYNEPYESAEMSQSVLASGSGELIAEYGLVKNGRRLRIQAIGRTPTVMPDEGMLEHFFKEHELGVGRDRRGNTLAYKVWHPRWNVFPLRASKVEVDWSGLYGPRFEFLREREPDSVVFAEGSEIKVYLGSRTETS